VITSAGNRKPANTERGGDQERDRAADFTGQPCLIIRSADATEPHGPTGALRGVTDNEVQQWLTDSQALAEASSSAADQVHATVGFAQLAWVRGDHDAAVRLMEQALPTLRRLGDQRCTGRALHMLGQRAYELHQLDRAERFLAGSIDAIVNAGQSFVLVNALEALAAVYAARGRPRPAAMLLGTAQTVRESASAHMRPVQLADDQLRRSLEQILGPAGFDAAHAHGRRLPPARALESVRWSDLRPS
jgi:hypothetical protein